MGRKCLVCLPNECKKSFLYAVADDMRGLVKIGATVNVARRMSSYRANGNTFFRLVYKQDTKGCEFTASGKERKAINSLDQALRVRGDWFALDESIAINAIQRAIG